MKNFAFIFISLLSFISNAQSIIDTVKTSNGVMLIYSNRTWTFLEDLNFDGVLNPQIAAHFEKDTFYHYIQKWDNDDCFTSDHKNDLLRLKDTFILDLNSEKNGHFHKPVPGAVTSHYGFRSGRYHNGIDLDLETGDTVYAAWSGKIRYAKWNDGGFGNLVIIRHENGLETIYAHLSKHLVAADQEVVAGQPIGLGGNTGRSFGAHLHFETRFYDAAINPEEIINFEKGDTKTDSLKLFAALFKPGVKPSDTWAKPVNGIVNEGTEVAVVQAAPIAKSPSAARYYKVKSGDTLSKIAAKHNTTVSKLCSLNRLKPTSTIRPGQSIRVK